MGATGWRELDLESIAGETGRYRTTIGEQWQLALVPQGGIVAAIAARAMGHALGAPEQTLRSLSAVFAGRVAMGPVEIDVTVLRSGRSMSQLTATVRNPGADAGLTAIGVFGASRRGFGFTDLVFPEVEAAEDLRGFRDPLPEGVDVELDGEPRPFWDQIIECRPAIGTAPWEPWADGPAEVVYWYRLDDPPVLDDGTLDPLASIVVCDTMPGAVGQKVGPDGGNWFGPSADLTIHLLGSARPGWLLAHNRARHAGDGYASVEMALWDPTDRTLVAYATQVMFFSFVD